VHQYRSSRGGAIEWRQAGDAIVSATAKPTRHYDIRGRGRNARLGLNINTAGPITGSSNGTFSLTASSVASVLVSGSSNVGLSLTGSATGILSIAAASDGVLSLGGSASGTIAQDGWGSDGIFTLSGSAAAVVSIAGASSGTLALTGSATGQIAQPGGGTADPADVWNFVLTNGKTAQQTLVETHAMLAELYRIHGLAAGEPLVVDKFTRTAGDIEQAITQVGDVVTVTRTS